MNDLQFSTMLLAGLVLILLLVVLALVVALVKQTRENYLLLKNQYTTAQKLNQSLLNQLRVTELPQLASLNQMTLPPSPEMKASPQLQTFDDDDPYLGDGVEMEKYLQSQGLSLGQVSDDLAAAGWPATIVRGRDGATFGD